MGIFSFLKFIEVIEWLDNSQNTIVYRFPVMDNDIKMGAKLTVRESQAAVFINEGKLADVFTPGLYILETSNMPILTKLNSWPYGFNSPFKAEVYFVNTKLFTDQKWGTNNPIMMRDADFGILRLRAYGSVSFRVGDPAKMIQWISGTNGLYDTDSIIGQLRSTIVSSLSDLLGELKIPALDLAANYDEINEKAREKINTKFEDYGLNLTSFYVENISLPEEVEKKLDKRTEMNILGNMQQYTQYQAADALKDAANNPGGLAGAGVGIGAGATMGSAFVQSINAPQSSSPAQQPNIVCAGCGTQIPQSAKFCPKCGKPMSDVIKCIKCGAEIKAGSKYCSVCGASQAQGTNCKKCGHALEADEKFCSECGEKAV